MIVKSEKRLEIVRQFIILNKYFLTLLSNAIWGGGGMGQAEAHLITRKGITRHLITRKA